MKIYNKSARRKYPKVPIEADTYKGHPCCEGWSNGKSWTEDERGRHWVSDPDVLYVFKDIKGARCRSTGYRGFEKANEAKPKGNWIEKYNLKIVYIKNSFLFTKEGRNLKAKGLSEILVHIGAEETSNARNLRQDREWAKRWRRT